MKPLSTAQQMQTWLCLYPHDEASSIWEIRTHIAFAFTINAIQLFGISAGITFVLRFISINFEISLFGCMVCLNHSSVVYMNLVAFIMRNKIYVIFGDLLEIYKECKNTSINIMFRYNLKS